MSDITQNQKSMKKFYDDISEKYDLIFSLSPLHKTFFAEEIKGKKVLDVGAGTGNLSQYLLGENYDVTAIDINEKLIKKAKEKGVEIVNMSMLDIDKLPKFTTIINIGNTLPHLENKKEISDFLQKAYAQLEQGGKLIIQMVNFWKFTSKNKEGNFLGNLPMVDNEGVTFERSYYLNEEGNIIFKTILDKKVENEEVLININYQELKVFLENAGFKNIQFYGGFNKVDFSPENSMPVIVTAEKL